MIRLTKVIILGFSVGLYSTMCAQDSSLVSDSSKTSTTIITSVPFNGVNYFIKITPVNPKNIDNMPIANPNSRNVFIWRDSIQHLLPDSVLRYIQKQRDIELKLNSKIKSEPKR